jgi:hypothetical protein
MSRTGHAGNSGLQSHSVGDIYPYSIVVIDRAVGAGYGVCQGRNLITGEVVCNVQYNNNGPAGSFESAHRTAEFICADRKGRDDDAAFAAALDAELAQPAQSAELTVCRLILPIVRNSDGAPHSAELWDFVKHYFCDVFGGFTNRSVVGGWRGPDGKIICDSSIEFEAAGDAAAVKNLTDRAADIAVAFDQICVYVAVGATAKLYYRPLA